MMMGTINCTYETPCGWCAKWDKKCDKKIGIYIGLTDNSHVSKDILSEKEVKPIKREE